MAHAFCAAGEDELAGTGLDLHASLQDCLEAGSAAAVDLWAGDVDSEARVEGSDAVKRGGFTVRGCLSEDDVVDIGP